MTADRGTVSCKKGERATGPDVSEARRVRGIRRRARETARRYSLDEASKNAGQRLSPATATKDYDTAAIAVAVVTSTSHGYGGDTAANGRNAVQTIATTIR